MNSMGRDCSVGIATRYGLDGPGIESRWGARFTARVQTGRGVHPDFYTMGTGSFSGVRRPGRVVGYPPPSSAEVKERVELYLYSPSGPSCPVLWWTLRLPLPFTCFLYCEPFLKVLMIGFRFICSRVCIGERSSPEQLLHNRQANVGTPCRPTHWSTFSL
jgi:hypothetical protein